MAPLRLIPVMLSAALASISMTGPVLQTGRWLPPIESPLQVSGPYRAPPSEYASGHRGIDIPATPGDAVYAPVAGTVSFAGQVVDRRVLSIRVDASTTVSFEPVDVQALDIQEGSEVLRGEEIGVVASGGHCADECLHLGVRIRGLYVNPMRFFFHKPVLLPWRE